jgi:two-component system NtrC family response regulator
LLISSIEQNRGNIVKTAEALRVSRPTLYDLLKKHGLHSPVE